jgi:hypothetical protein
MDIRNMITNNIAYYLDATEVPKTERVKLYMPLKHYLTFLHMRKLEPSAETITEFMKSHNHRKYWKKILENYVEFLLNDDED